jgi:hypothetical protein
MATTTSAQQARQDDHRHAWVTNHPIVYFIIGAIVLFFWAWANLMQIQTSEAWMLQQQVGLSLTPHFELLGQLTAFWAGKLTPAQQIADSWGWGVQIFLLVCSIGIERPQMFFHKKYNANIDISASVSRSANRRASIFWALSIFLIVLNSIADFNYSGTVGFWGQVGFCIVTLGMSFYFGLLGFQMIAAGLHGMKH